MFNLFDKTKLFQLDEDLDANIRLSVFGRCKVEDVKTEDSNQEPNFVPKSQLVLYLDNYCLVLFQFRNESILAPINHDESEPLSESFNVRKFTIPLDQQKGHIVSMCFNQSCTELLAITENSLIYLIPFNIETQYDSVQQKYRNILMQDASVIRCCSLKLPISIVWWQRSESYCVEHNSIAIVANKTGFISFVDLQLQNEFKRCSVPFPICSLSIFDEMYTSSLLITCQNGFQYQVVLELFRSSHQSSHYDINSSPNWNNYYLSCILNLQIGNDSQVLGKVSPNKSSPAVCESDSPSQTLNLRPQLITFNNDIDNISIVGSDDVDDFFVFTEDITTPKMAIHSQPHCGWRPNIFVVRQQNPKIELKQKKSLDSDYEHHPENSDFVSLEQNSPSSDFCNVTVNKDIVLEIYEFPSQDFCTKSILLNTSRLYLTNICNDIECSGEEEQCQKLLRLIDCGFRFLLLVYSDRCLLVSKAFAEQKNSCLSSSPRSPRLLKKTDSRGSFRRKTASSGGASSLSIVEEFRFFDKESENTNKLTDTEIVEVFLISSPGPTGIGIKELIAKQTANVQVKNEACSSNDYGFQKLDSIVRYENNIIETLISESIEEAILIEEIFLVITKRTVFVLDSRQRSFGRYFHNEVLSILSSIESGAGGQDGDIITRAKLLVDCFGVCRPGNLSRNNSQPLGTTATMPSQSWQIWLARSALILLKEFKQTPDATNTINVDYRLNQIFRLMELSRTSRRRLITSLVYFRFWWLAIKQVRKFFHTRTLLELSYEERIYLIDQLFHSLLAVYLPLMHHNQSDGNSNNETAVQDAKKCKKNLYEFFYRYRPYYDSTRVITRLLELNLAEMARYVALTVGNYHTLVQLLLRKLSQINHTENRKYCSKIWKMLTSKRVTYSLILSTQYLSIDEHHYGGGSIELIENYLGGFVFPNLAYLSTYLLFRLAQIFNPSRLSVQVLINQTLEYCNQTYLREPMQSNLQSDDIQHISNVSVLPIKKKDLLNLYIFISVLYLRRLRRKQLRTKLSIPKALPPLYEWDFEHNIYWFADKIAELDKELTSQKSISPKKLVYDKKDKWKICAGTFCSIVFNSENFSLVGKFNQYQPSIKPKTCLTDPVDGTCTDMGTPIKSNLSRHHCEWKQNDFFSTVLNVEIISIVCGYQHILIHTELGIFALGSSEFGQLGLGCKVLEAGYPLLLEDFKVTIAKLACGAYHSLAITSNCELYSWGWGLHGQLGYGCIEDRFEPQLVDFFTGDESLRVKDVAAGYAHTAVLTITGDLYLFGDNTYGQLGIKQTASNIKNKYVLPKKLEMFESPIQLISCGLFHTLALTQEQVNLSPKLSCFGVDPKTSHLKIRSDRAASNQLYKSLVQKNDSASLDAFNVSLAQNELNYTKIKDIQFIHLMEPNEHIVKMSAGQSHSLLLTSLGRVFAFGYGREGQLGLGNNIHSTGDEAFSIYEFWTENQGPIVDVHCGATHSLALDADGKVWGWGQNADYQLQHREQHETNNPSTQENNTVTPAQARKNSFIQSLAKREEQLMTRMMSLQKNSIWSPIVIHQTSLAPSDIGHQNKIDMHVCELKDEISSKDYRNGSKIKQMLLNTLVHYRHELDYRALIKRFEQLDFFQFCSILSCSQENYTDAYRFEMSALSTHVLLELKSGLSFCEKSEENDTNSCMAQGMVDSDSVDCYSFYTKCSQQICKLTWFFVQKCSNSPNDIYDIVQCLVNTWKKLFAFFSENHIEIDFVESVLNRIYLGSDNDTTSLYLIDNPYLALNLFRMIQNEDENETKKEKPIRTLLKITDQCMISLVEKTEKLIQTQPVNDSKIVSIQNLIESLLQPTSLFRCSSQNSDDTSSLFPLERRWKSILSMFDQYRCIDESTEYDNDSNTDQIKISIPSDIDSDDPSDDQKKGNNFNSILLLFQCGHYLSKRKFLAKISTFTQTIETTTSLADESRNLSIYQNIGTLLSTPPNTEEDFESAIDSIQSLIETISCPDCLH